MKIKLNITLLSTIFVFTMISLFQILVHPYLTSVENTVFANKNEPMLFPTGEITHTLFLPVVQKPIQLQPGKELLFISDRNSPDTGDIFDTKFDVYKMDFQGNNVTRLTNLEIDSYSGFAHRFLPQWSPDGTQIAIQVDKAIYLMNADGSQMTPLYEKLNDAANGIPVWSPDGSKIAFIAQNCLEPRPACNRMTGGGVRVIDIETKVITQVIPDGIFMDAFNDIEWTPDGNSVLAVPHEGFGGDDTGIIVGYLDGSPAKWILSGQFPEGFDISPDGQKIAFVSGSHLGVYTAGIEGNNIETVYYAVPDSKFVSDIVWSPIGNKVAYRVSESNSLDNTIYVANPDGSNAQDILPGNHSLTMGLKGWLPDGSGLIFNSDKGRTYRHTDIYTVSEDGSNLINLTADSPEDDAVADYR